ncbi:MAG: ribonuclease HI family protein [Candidatus Omnitrophica bacterium]|nr:ribonuclease HI family protein [Candidatus Omnitrophota bacterium]
MSKRSFQKVVAFIDGASRGNPGPAAIGVVFQDKEGRELKRLSKKAGITTNNVAEYLALLIAMQEALILQVEELEVFTDSELLASQYQGEYKVKDERLKILHWLAMHLRGGFKQVSVTHIPREKNRLADKEANKALDQDLWL